MRSRTDPTKHPVVLGWDLSSVHQAVPLASSSNVWCQVCGPAPVQGLGGSCLVGPPGPGGPGVSEPHGSGVSGPDVSEPHGSGVSEPGVSGPGVQCGARGCASAGLLCCLLTPSALCPSSELRRSSAARLALLGGTSGTLVSTKCGRVPLFWFSTSH